MRTGGNADDRALLEAMGETLSSHRTEKLQKTAPEVAAALARNIAFNARITELEGRGFSLDQAILQMRANPVDAALLAAMGG